MKDPIKIYEENSQVIRSNSRNQLISDNLLLLLQFSENEYLQLKNWVCTHFFRHCRNTPEEKMLFHMLYHFLLKVNSLQLSVILKSKNSLHILSSGVKEILNFKIVTISNSLSIRCFVISKTMSSSLDLAHRYLPSLIIS